MNRFRREIMWAALVLIVVLMVLSIYGAFIGADRAKMFFNSAPVLVFWVLFGLVLISGLVAFRRLIRLPGLLLKGALLMPASFSGRRYAITCQSRE